jgi:hypothetical protein
VKCARQVWPLHSAVPQKVIFHYQCIVELTDWLDTYKNCAWYSCDDTCPSDKVLITQRTQIDAWDEVSGFKECSSGYEKWCCDPPSESGTWPVDPKDIFKYPDEDDVSYYYKVEESSNDEGGWIGSLWGSLGLD